MVNWSNEINNRLRYVIIFGLYCLKYIKFDSCSGYYVLYVVYWIKFDFINEDKFF